MWSIKFRVRVWYIVIYICTKESRNSFFFYFIYFFITSSFCTFTLRFVDFSFLLILFLFACLFFILFWNSIRYIRITYQNVIEGCFHVQIFSAIAATTFLIYTSQFFFFYVYSMRWGVVIPIFQIGNWDWERMLIKDHPQSLQLQWFLNPGQSPACDLVDHTGCCSCHLCFF